MFPSRKINSLISLRPDSAQVGITVTLQDSCGDKIKKVAHIVLNRWKNARNYESFAAGP